MGRLTKQPHRKNGHLGAPALGPFLVQLDHALPDGAQDGAQVVVHGEGGLVGDPGGGSFLCFWFGFGLIGFWVGGWVGG